MSRPHEVAHGANDTPPIARGMPTRFQRVDPQGITSWGCRVAPLFRQPCCCVILDPATHSVPHIVLQQGCMDSHNLDMKQVWPKEGGRGSPNVQKVVDFGKLPLFKPPPLSFLTHRPRVRQIFASPLIFVFLHRKNYPLFPPCMSTLNSPEFNGEFKHDRKTRKGNSTPPSPYPTLRCRQPLPRGKIFGQKNSPHICVQNHQRDMGIILSSTCRGTWNPYITPPAPPPWTSFLPPPPTPMFFQPPNLVRSFHLLFSTPTKSVDSTHVRNLRTDAPLGSNSYRDGPG